LIINRGGINTNYVKKDARVSPLDAAIYSSMQTPGSKYNLNWSSQERKISSPSYRKAVKPGYDESCWLKQKDPATKLLSPMTYKAMDSYNMTQLRRSAQFSLTSRRKGDHIETAIR
jgi:hypothetical protein